MDAWVMRDTVDGRITPWPARGQPAETEDERMRLLLIGAPGAGKGTQAVRLADQFGVTHISSGDLLRSHIADETSLGRTVEQAEAAYLAARDLGVAVQVAAHLDVDEEELVRRLLARGRGAEDTAEV